MRVSHFFLSTLKEAPAEAEVMSQQLMVRSGMIKRVTSGIYSWLTLGLMTLRKVEQIVREEMNRAGALECYCLLYTSPSPRDYAASRMPSSA